jgi:hypothetical protein
MKNRAINGMTENILQAGIIIIVFILKPCCIYQHCWWLMHQYLICKSFFTWRKPSHLKIRISTWFFKDMDLSRGQISISAPFLFFKQAILCFF